jgi:hypothetical protein
MLLATADEVIECGCFAALHESGFGPKRHFAAPKNNVAIGVTTDIDRHGY